MNIDRSHSQKVMAEALGRRQRKNASYSLRAFSRYLEMSPAVVSDIINGKRSVPKKSCENIADKLELSPKERALFIKSALAPKQNLRKLSAVRVKFDEAKILDEENHHKIISEWEHYAILSLTGTAGFQSDSEWIAKRMGITKTRAEDCIQRLISADLLREIDGTLKPTNNGVKTTTDVSSVALRKAHKETLELAKEKIDSVPVKARDYTSSVVAIDPRNLPKAKKLLEEFRRKFSKLLKEGECSEVYQIAIQLFPMTCVNSQNLEV